MNERKMSVFTSSLIPHLCSCRLRSIAISYSGKEFDMARSQKWTRNTSKKIRSVVKPDLSRSIVDPGTQEGILRRAEDSGLIVHAQNKKQTKRKKGSKK